MARRFEVEKLYLAGSYGFKEIDRNGIQPLIDILAKKFELILPFEKAKDKGLRLAELEQELRSDKPSVSPAQILKEMQAINFQIGFGNVEHIRACDRILAIADGPDQDAGAAAECGFGYALGKRCDAYRNDFRPSGENSACIMSLQLEYFIRASGGIFFFSFAEVKMHFEI
ncbi:MAG: nucleoside 2-deoxyribosyltransferase [Candidatus Parcubacteria bacterium]|nr:nucleoside 2-deoxyribosyltransferase [Candidatus Parcubacteria bacterium]